MAKKKAKDADDNGEGLSFHNLIQRMEHKRSIENDGVFTRLVSILPDDFENHIVDVFVTEIIRCRLPSKLMIICPACDKLQEPQDLSDYQSIKLVGRSLTKASHLKSYIRKNFDMGKCPKCDSPRLDYTIIGYREALELEIRDVHVRSKSHEFELEQNETAYYIYKDLEEREEFTTLIESGQSIRVELCQIVKHLPKQHGAIVFQIFSAALSTDIIIDDKVQDPERLRRLGNQGLIADDYPGNVKKITRSFAQWIGGLDFIKEMVAIWGLSCPDDPVVMFLTGDSQVAKSQILRSFMNWHRKVESESRDKSYIHDVCLQGENTKRTAFYMHDQVKRGGEQHWRVKRGVGLKSRYGRLFIDSICVQNKEIIDVIREAITQHVLTVAGAGTEGLPREYPFITRLAATFNTKRETHKVKNLYDIYRYDLLPDVFGYMDLNRFGIKLLLKNNDVKTEVKTDAMIGWEAGVYNDLENGMVDGKVRFLPPMTFRKLKALCDSLRKDDFKFLPEAMEKVNDLYKRKLELYQGTRVEFYCNALRDQIKAILRGMAFINYYWSDVDGKMRLIITPELVDILETKMDEIEKMWGLNEMLVDEGAAQEEEMVLWELMLTIENTLKLAVFKLIVGGQGGATLHELSEGVNRRNTQVSAIIKWLRDQELIQPTKVRGHYTVTRKGALAWRIFCDGPDLQYIVQWFIDMTSMYKDGITLSKLYELGEERHIPKESIDAMIQKFYVEEGRLQEVDNNKFKWI